MPAGLWGHRLQRSDIKSHKCMICGISTKNICGCGRAFCEVSKEGMCWAWHVHRVMTGAVEEALCSGRGARDPAIHERYRVEKVLGGKRMLKSCSGSTRSQ
jgi:hypothetical protein